jgi:hypothetical protein
VTGSVVSYVEDAAVLNVPSTPTDASVTANKSDDPTERNMNLLVKSLRKVGQGATNARRDED